MADSDSSEAKGARRLASPFPYKDQLIDDVQHGKLKPEEAEERARERGLMPLASKPDAGEFDPMSDVAWSIPMAIAWIASKELENVRFHCDAYRRKYQYWTPAQEWIVPGGEQHIGCFIAELPPATVNGLLVWGNEALGGDFSAPDAEKMETAKSELWQALQSGKIVANAIEESTRRRVSIPAIEWRDLEDRSKHNRPLRLGSQAETSVYCDVVVDSVTIMERWPLLTAAVLEIPPHSKPKNSRYKYPKDKHILLGVLEELTSNPDAPIERTICETARILTAWPENIDDQERLTDRLRRRVGTERQKPNSGTGM